MRTRILLGSTMIAAIAGLFVFDYYLQSKIAISAFVVLLGLGAWLELSRLGGVAAPDRGGSLGLFLVGLLSSAYFLCLPWIERAMAPGGSWLSSAGLAGLLLGSFCAVMFRADYEERFKPLFFTVVAVLLYAHLFSYLLRIYQAERGTVLGVVFILGVKGNDIAAYLVGRAIGKRRFLHVSPKKTLEGCLAAVVFSVIWFPAAAWVWPEIFFPWPQVIPLAIILSIATQAGDLSESLLKRCYQVKDSSSLIPEFGGILDLIDSVLFSGYLFWLLGANAAPAWK